MKKTIILAALLLGFFTSLMAQPGTGLLKPKYLGWPVDSFMGATLRWDQDSFRAVWALDGIGNDSIYGVTDTLCFIDIDTTCIPLDSVFFTPDSVCYILYPDTVCYSWEGANGNIYTINGGLTENRTLTLNDKYLRFVQAGTLNGLQVLPLSAQRMVAIQVDGNTANNRGLSQAALEIANTQITGTERNAYIRFLNGTNIYSMGQDLASPQGFTFSDSSNLKNPVWKYHSPGPSGGTAGDSLVFFKRTKFRSTLLDKEGDAGSSGNILTSTGTGINWATTSSLLDGNGFFTAANNGADIPTDFTADITDSLQFRGLLGGTDLLRINFHSPNTNGSSLLFLTNNTTGSSPTTDGLAIFLDTDEEGYIRLREDQGFGIGNNNLDKLYFYGTQAGAVYEPSVRVISAFVADKGIFNSANVEITGQDTLTKIQANVNWASGTSADTIFLPEIITNSPTGGGSLESATVTQTAVGQEYTISNYSGVSLVVSVMNVTGTDDQISGGSAITILDGKSAIVRANRYVGGIGYWHSFPSN